jgi:AraC family transcriptional regulator
MTINATATGHIKTIQRAVDYIESHITENLTVDEIAREAFVSKHYFQRLFTETAGIPVMRYVTKRRLQYAFFDIVRGVQVTDVAFQYGFESHAGFTRAFKRVFGYPPSFYRNHLPVEIPVKLHVAYVFENKEGVTMEAKMVFKEKFTIAGYLLRKNLGHVHTRDIPVFYDDCGPIADISSKLNHVYATLKPKIHGEFSLAVNPSGDNEDFSYLLAVRADDPLAVPEDMICIEIPEGTYAVFTTPWANDNESIEVTRKTWTYILNEWFPNSEYEIDENGYDYEYEDERAHAWENNGKTCCKEAIDATKNRQNQKLSAISRVKGP